MPTTPWYIYNISAVPWCSSLILLIIVIVFSVADNLQLITSLVYWAAKFTKLARRDTLVLVGCLQSLFSQWCTRLINSSSSQQISRLETLGDITGTVIDLGFLTAGSFWRNFWMGLGRNITGGLFRISSQRLCLPKKLLVR